ncbi:MAG: ABC transporter permease [Bacillota bacterium]
MNQEQNQLNSKQKFINFSRRYPAVFITLAVFLSFSVISPYFLNMNNMGTIMSGNAVVMIAAIGETMVLLTGGIDLSVATIISASAVISGQAMSMTGSIAVGVLVAILVGIAFGLLNGFMIGYCKMSPFITTMGTQLVARGIAFIVSQGIAVKGTPIELVYFGFSKVAGIPSIFLISVVLLILSGIAVGKTTWGRQVILFGANAKTAQYTGVDVRKIEASTYVFSGLFAGIAGFISIANLGNGIPGVGDTLLLIILGGVVLGGTSMSGGEGSITRTVIGIALLAILTNGLSSIGVPFYDQLMVQGVLIFIGNGLAIKMSKKSEFAM